MEMRSLAEEDSMLVGLDRTDRFLLVLFFDLYLYLHPLDGLSRIIGPSREEKVTNNSLALTDDVIIVAHTPRQNLELCS